ncbi:MAG: excinuclease ABC subunit UvrA, partial [Patescibacteria group bacterium]
MKNDQNNKIIIRGARVHNLKNINLEIPRNKLVVITGLSGSGKSSLAFDTIYAEGQRRYIESLSSSARQFLGVMDKPDVDKIEGLSPAISIDQKSVSRNPRSTVGTVTEIYDYLRLLFARVGKPHCPECGRPVSKQSPSQIADKIAKWERGTEFLILAPVVRGKKGEHRALIQEIANAGYLRLRVNGEVMLTGEALEMKVDRYKIHHIEAVIDRMVVEKGLDRTRLVSSIETALKIGKGLMIAAKKTSGVKTGFEDILFSEMFSCPECGINLPEIEPRLFSFNSPYGACSECTGLGSKLEVDPPLVVPNPNLTIAEGAIKPWSGIAGQGWHFWELQKLAESQNFSLNVPFKSLPQKTVDLIMFGKKEDGFEGVAANLERRWKETDSDWARNEMEKYML